MNAQAIPPNTPAPANAAQDDDMPSEIDFSSGVRGKFYQPGTVLRFPVYLDQNVQGFLAAKADAKGVELSDLVNDLLQREIELIRAVG